MKNFQIENGVLIKYLGTDEYVTIPEGVIAIGQLAFMNSKLRGVIIPEGVVSIGDSAFHRNENLREVNLPNSLTNIGYDAFSKCLSLENVTIPLSVKHIGGGAFNHTPWQKCKGAFVVVNGLLLKYQGDDAHVEIPEGVTHIASSAFEDCSTVESVVIPASVTNIGSYAFFNCKSLRSIVIPENVVCIEHSTFRACSNLENVYIPDRVISIGKYAFSGCDKLKTIDIPDSVCDIGECAFNWCGDLQRVNVRVCEKQSSLIPTETNDQQNIPMHRLGDEAFRCCMKLQSVALPAGVTSIGEKPFAYCDKLPIIQAYGISLSDCDTKTKRMMVIGFLANSSGYCDDRKAEYIKYLNGQKKRLLKQATLSDDVSLFASYEQFGITLQPSLRDELIEQASANSKMNVLAWLMDYKNRTADVKKEQKQAERVAQQQLSNPYLAKFLRADWAWTKLEDGTMRIDKYKGKDADVAVPPFIGDVPVTSIGDCAFCECKQLQTIQLPEGITAIGQSAFFRCKQLQSILLPEGITTIGESAFSCCEQLQSIQLPKGVTTIGGLAFIGCIRLQNVAIPDTVISIGDAAFDHTPWLLNEGTFVVINGILQKYQGMDEHVVVPEGVTHIGDSAFSRCDFLQSVILPETLISIGDDAFSCCHSLVSIQIPQSVTTFGGGVFSYTPWIEDQGEFVVVNGILLKYQGWDEHVVIPEDVTTIGYAAFAECETLVSVVIPSNVTVIDEVAFEFCSSLETVEIADSVIHIGYGSFGYCDNLTTITLPKHIPLDLDYGFSEDVTIIQRG